MGFTPIFKMAWGFHLLWYFNTVFLYAGSFTKIIAFMPRKNKQRNDISSSSSSVDLVKVGESGLKVVSVGGTTGGNNLEPFNVNNNKTANTLFPKSHSETESEQLSERRDADSNTGEADLEFS